RARSARSRGPIERGCSWVSCRWAGVQHLMAPTVLLDPVLCSASLVALRSPFWSMPASSGERITELGYAPQSVGALFRFSEARSEHPPGERFRHRTMQRPGNVLDSCG